MTQRTIAERLVRERRRAFVGRHAERELFTQALETGAFAVLHLYGPGGIGKSTLLAEFAALARARGVPFVAVDGGAIAPRADELQRALAHPPDEVRVVVIDSYEELASLDAWVRETLLPTLPEGSVLVLAGRDPPNAAWRTDPGLAAVQRVRALRNLDRTESAALLAARGIADPEQHDGAHAVTHGHPLALVLLAELLRERTAPVPTLTPDIVRELLERILESLPEPRQRDTLEIAALARVTTEALLTDFEIEPAGPLFAWLRARSFVQESADGVAPHDLVRDAIAADLAFRDPERERAWRARLEERARRAMHEGDPRTRERAFYDALFTLRDDPAMRRFYDWERGQSGAAEPLDDAQFEQVHAAIAMHEGDRSADIARHWWKRRRSEFRALYDRVGAWVGTLAYLRLLSIEPVDVEFDPAVSALDRIARHSPIRKGEHASLLRFWIWRDGYQELGSAAHGPHSMVVSLDWMLAPALSWVVLVVQRADVWREFFEALGFTEHHAEAFELADRRFHVFARDFRAQPWIGVEAPTLTKRALRPPPRVVLAQADFESAVRDALRSALDPDALDRNPLVRSRLLAEWAEDEAPNGAMLRELLEIAASAIGDPRDERPRRCVELTYLKPMPTQELAAERLGLSFSTYRRQLALGVARIATYLWEREVGGLKP